MITDGTIFVSEGTDKIYIQVTQHLITVSVENTRIRILWQIRARNDYFLGDYSDPYPIPLDLEECNLQYSTTLYKHYNFVNNNK